MIALLFQAPLFAGRCCCWRCSCCGTIGFAAVGTLFAAMLVRARTRDVMLPILLYPITIPVIIAGVRGTSALLASPPDEPMAMMWIGDPAVVRRRVRDAVALDVRAADDGVDDDGGHGHGWAGVTCSVACPAVVESCYEKALRSSHRSDRGAVRVRAGRHRQRAVRVDDAAGAEDLLLPRAGVDGDVSPAIAVCGVASAVYLFKDAPPPTGSRSSAAELTVLFGAIGLVTGPLWGRKAWGVWWQWDARLTMALLLELIFVAYLLVRKYGGPGSEKLAAAVGLFGMANVAVRLQVGEHLADDSSADHRGADAAARDARAVLVLLRRVHAAVRGPAEAADDPREAAGDARRPVSG